ncbi:MAG: L,D-transpeptidase family protein [Verrucomicrobia bacterium]|nr:L,D-transpeptidase family protein [Verrucomicrobiota bacterium]
MVARFLWMMLLLAVPALGQTAHRIAEFQIALDRQFFSPGCIDDHVGTQTRAALRAWQVAKGEKVTGVFDEATTDALRLEAPAFIRYEITTNDFARLGRAPESWRERAEQDSMPYQTALELVAEKFHASQRFIRALNPQIPWDSLNTPTNALVPNVEFDAKPPKAGEVRINLAQKWLTVYDGEGKLCAFFPCSIGRDKMKRPVGELQIVAVAPNPNYTFNPAVFPESPEAQAIGTKLIIPPGPNNPVGVLWLSIGRAPGSEGPPLTGYGIHGTPKPEEVGRTESHGCFRLANFNAERLLKMITVGTPVIVEEE